MVSLVGRKRISAKPYPVRPGVNADFVALHVLLNKDGRSLNDTGADDKEGSKNILLFEVVEEVLS